MAFKAGETVRLKSGGPLMTVSGMTKGDEPKVICDWFDDKNSLQHGAFVEVQIEADDNEINIG